MRTASSPSLAPLLPEAQRSALLQARQFVIAGRAEVERFPPDEEIVRLFREVPRAEEHAFYNVLVYGLGYRRVTDIDVGCITFQRFHGGHESYRQPLACRRTARGLELEHEKTMLRAARPPYDCLFARKLAPTCDLACFAKSGFERFQCSGD